MNWEFDLIITILFMVQYYSIMKVKTLLNCEESYLFLDIKQDHFYDVVKLETTLYDLLNLFR